MSRAKLYKGYTRKILRVNLTAGTVVTEALKNGQLKTQEKTLDVTNVLMLNVCGEILIW